MTKKQWTPEERSEIGARLKAARDEKARQKKPVAPVSTPAPEIAPVTGTGKLSDDPKIAAAQVEAERWRAQGNDPKGLFSGFVRRLEYHNQKPGFVYQWINDEGNDIATSLKMGWRLTEAEEGDLNAAVTPRNNDLGSHVRQYVGTKEDGSPMNAYLMEMPESLYKEMTEGPGSREAYHQQLEAQIRAGTLGMKAGEKRYSAANPWPGTHSSLPPISLGTKTYTPK